ncbi:MAG: hypothetical protein ABIJ09_07910 [Pseudomonadota bacterium]
MAFRHRPCWHIGVAGLLVLAAAACPDGETTDGGGSNADARGRDHSVPFDVSPQPDLPWSPPDAASGCDGLGVLGRCEDGAVLRWCDDGEPVRVDCAAGQRSCGAQPELDDGSWCLGAAGASCAQWPCQPGLRCDGEQRCIHSDAGVEDS